jgi:ACS family glucarate transporter-like MFS transporter
MLAMAAAPDVFEGHAAFFALFAAQLGLGVAQAAIFPISSGVFSAWFPPRRWAFVQGLQTMGLQLGAAITPPLVVTLMAVVGWQRALAAITLPGLGLIGAWAWYARNTPVEHPGITAEELAEIGDHGARAADRATGFKQLLAVLGNRDVLLLGMSYLSMNYVFYLLSNWVFLYLVQERHFSALEGGWLASGPPLAAAVGAGLGGVLTSWSCARFGPRWGHRLLPVLALPLAGLLLLGAVHSVNPYWAVLALALCYLTIELTEGAYWSSAMTVGGSDTMTVGGFMNTGGNLGGIIGIPIVGYLSERHDWNTAFLLGAGLALVSAMAWLGIRSAAPPALPAASEAAVAAPVPA